MCSSLHDHEHGERRPVAGRLRVGRHRRCQHAGARPCFAAAGALVDWNNNYGDDPDKAVVFHCSNLPKTIIVERDRGMDYNAILAETFGRENAFGTVVGRVRACSPICVSAPTIRQAECAPTWARASSRTTHWRLSVATGSFASRVLQELLSFICENGFEHHVAVAQARVAAVLSEALVKYLDWSVYHHARESAANT